MSKRIRFAVPLALLGIILVPLFASASLGTPFGGRVLTVTPCLSPLGLAFHITIAPAGLSQVSYIYLPPPLTVTYLNGPPTHPGQSIVGVADTIFGCTVGGFFGFFGVPLVGQRMQMIGTSVAI